MTDPPPALDPALRDALDRVWLDAAHRLGLPVERGGDAYVHWDGRRLLLATDEHLDPDDSVAQLVLHEICHALVQGPAAFRLPDWGLDNTTNDDAVREAAAVRLQGHLLGRFGLRAVLFPTTVVRDFYFALPADALCPIDDESARLARDAATRAAAIPTGPILRAALERSSALVAPALHPRSGLPMPPTGAARCAACAFRSRGGLCREAPRRAFVRPFDPACVRFFADLECEACGACCRSAYGAVPVVGVERIARRRPELVDQDGAFAFVRRRGDRCAALDGPDGGPYRCVAYADRPRACRDFARGGGHCLEARRRVGLSF